MSQAAATTVRDGTVLVGHRRQWIAPPSAATLELLRREVGRLEFVLGPPEPAETLAASRMLTSTFILAFPAKRHAAGEDEEIGLAALWCEALEGLPIWSIEEARRLVATGQAGKLGQPFAPTCAEMAALARRLMTPTTCDHNLLRRALEVIPAPALADGRDRT